MWGWGEGGKGGKISAQVKAVKKCKTHSLGVCHCIPRNEQITTKNECTCI